MQWAQTPAEQFPLARAQQSALQWGQESASGADVQGKKVSEVLEAFTPLSLVSQAENSWTSSHVGPPAHSAPAISHKGGQDRKENKTSFWCLPSEMQLSGLPPSGFHCTSCLWGLPELKHQSLGECSVLTFIFAAQPHHLWLVAQWTNDPSHHLADWDPSVNCTGDTPQTAQSNREKPWNRSSPSLLTPTDPCPLLFQSVQPNTDATLIFVHCVGHKCFVLVLYSQLGKA